MGGTGGGSCSMDEVLSDGGIVALVLGRLRSARDKHAAALVCKLWHEVFLGLPKPVIVRSRDALSSVVRTVKRVVALDLSCCSDQLNDYDLKFCASALGGLTSLTLGHADESQDFISDDGVLAFAENCKFLEQVKLTKLPRIGDVSIQGFSSGCKKLWYLNIHDCRSLTDESLEAIGKISSLEELHLKGECRFSSVGLARLGAHCHGLQKVCWNLGPLRLDPVLRFLAEGCPKLQELSLKTGQVDLMELARCSSLQVLSIETDHAWDRDLKVDEAVVAIAKANRNLREFSFLSTGGHLNDDAVAGLILACPLLETLQLDSTKLTDATLMCIVACKSLRCLFLDGLRSGGVGLTQIGQCGLGLKSLALRHARRVCDVQLQTLMHGNRGLESLDLQWCSGPSSIGFAAIALCSKLQFLDLTATEIDDLSLLVIARGALQVKQLNLVKCKRITSMETIAQFANLEVLILDQCPFVRDDGLDLVAGMCPHLKHISLAFTRVTDKGLQHLVMCTQLQSLRVSYCRFVLGNGVVAIAKACSQFNQVVMSHRFRDTATYEALKKQNCKVCLEMDDMALVPFGFNLLM